LFAAAGTPMGSEGDDGVIKTTTFFTRARRRRIWKGGYDIR